MKITLTAIGKLKEKYLKEAVLEYGKRLSRYCKLEIIELPDEKAGDNLSLLEETAIKNKEGYRILQRIHPSFHLIALAIDGEQKSSEELASRIDTLGIQGTGHIAFIIGGSLGLSDEVLKRANEKLSFSKMTFPHQLMRVILLEQIYRSFKINNRETYHK